MRPTFDDFLSQLKPTNVGLDFFTDFEKVERNVSSIEMHLNSLNFLLGKADLGEAIELLYRENPNCFSVLNVLIAVRTEQKKYVLNSKGECIQLQLYLSGVEKIKEFIFKTGLGEVFKTPKVKNLVDYVFGVEVGLDTNARKNRGGTYMETAVSNLFSNANLDFEEQVRTSSIPSLKWLGVDVKQFDFLIRTSKTCYLVETNFYSSGGSKLNETARSYVNLADLIAPIEGFEFVWITDGLGWMTAKNKLGEAYEKIDRLYNLTTIEHFLQEVG